MAVGTCYKREGTTAYFYSKKGAWRGGIEIKGMDPTNVVPGYRYEISNDFKEIVKRMEQNQWFEKDIAEHRLELGQSGPVVAPADPPPPQPVPLNGLMASATGFCKSAMESGLCKTWEDAAKAGGTWASLWGEVPDAVKEIIYSSAPPPTEETTTKGEPNDPPW